jgi:lipoate-protein ligase A
VHQPLELFQFWYFWVVPYAICEQPVTFRHWRGYINLGSGQMKYLDLTLPTPEANLAFDEALLDWCDANPNEEVLRFWESSVPFVVLGYGNNAGREASLALCKKQGVPVLRRCSGGGAVLQGSGCLNYAVFLNIERNAALASIPSTNRFIMEQHRLAFERILHKRVAVRGHTDLVVEDRKFSGNSQRRKRQALLFHGTFLLNFPLELMVELLPFPSKQPTYRNQRQHVDFLCNLPIPADVVKQALRQAWQAEEAFLAPPLAATQKLVHEKYSRDEWNLQR